MHNPVENWDIRDMAQTMHEAISESSKYKSQAEWSTTLPTGPVGSHALAMRSERCSQCVSLNDLLAVWR